VEGFGSLSPHHRIFDVLSANRHLRCGASLPAHTLEEALEQAAILSDVTPEIAIIDRGYRGAEPDGVKVYHPGPRRGITRTLRAMIRRRSAIEPAIGHMKTDGKLDRNWLKGALGDAINAVLCGAGHNLRMILRRMRRLYVLVLVSLLNHFAAFASTSVSGAAAESELLRPDF
jgi:IS5 family transposase